uniref:Uncharacterized protein DKFZp547A118 n=1 Tax=Homo sapiens TaxID=9606 RepID=Q8NDS2_HUMAN|nr:hypothetical protein [Homo sapiens]
MLLLLPSRSTDGAEGLVCLSSLTRASHVCLSQVVHPEGEVETGGEQRRWPLTRIPLGALGHSLGRGQEKLNRFLFSDSS